MEAKWDRSTQHRHLIKEEKKGPHNKAERHGAIRRNDVCKDSLDQCESEQLTKTHNGQPLGRSVRSQGSRSDVQDTIDEEQSRDSDGRVVTHASPWAERQLSDVETLSGHD